MMTLKSWRVPSVLPRCGLMCLVLLAVARSGWADSADQAKQIADLANFHGGFVVHVGCGDGQLTAALRLADNCVVQGLETDASRVARARATIQKLGVYGPVSVIQWDGERLPYTNNLATMIVCEDPSAASADELTRVLRPFGALVVKKKNQWMVTVKPQMPGTDQWEQHYHNADNNAVARDTVVGPPRRYQWRNTPEWQRSHLAMPSINSMVSTNGRLFTVEDEGSAEHPALPGEQALVARDAYNGIVLWKVKFSNWHPIYIRNKEMPVQIQRRMVAIGDLIYCTPGYSAPISVYDAATGSVIKTHANTAGTMEFVYDDGVLFTVTGDQSDISDALSDLSRSALKSSTFPLEAYGPIIKRRSEPQNAVVAIDAESGRELWRLAGSDTNGYQGATLAVSGKHVVFSTATELVCVDRATGKTSWRVPAAITLKGPAGIAVSLVLSETGAYLADSSQLRAFRLTDGKQLWSNPVTVNHHKAPDVYVTGGLVWAAAYDASTGRPSPALGLNRMGVNGFDPETGKVVKQLDQTMLGPMGHDRCYRNRITTKYYINSVTGGSDFLTFATPNELPNPWIRSTCGIGPLPCNGLYYVGPPSCACCNSVMLNGMNSLAPEPGLTKDDQPIKVAADGTLEKGPAFSQISDLRSQISNLKSQISNLRSTPSDRQSASDWPTYRHDNARTASTKNAVPAQLVKRWETKLGTRASAPVIAAGKVFAADVDGHSVCALSASDGKIVWRFTAGGRVDSPPTYYEGLVLFGSRDGTAYCLRATDGALAWRFHPLEKRQICAYGQPESAWPICGNIMIRDGLAYFAAGRNSFIDGGIFVYALDPCTGKVVHQKHMYGPFGENGFPIENREVVNGMSIEGFKGDIFIGGEKLVFLRHQAFKPDLSPIALKDVKERHVIPSHGFLEAIPQHRSFWTIDTMLHYDIPTGLGGVNGDILAVDGSTFYEVRGYQPGRTTLFDPRVHGYTLYAGTFGKTAKPTANTTRKPNAKPAARSGAKSASTRTRKNPAAGAKRPVAKTTRVAQNKAKSARRKNTGPSNVAPSTQIWASFIPLTGKAIAATRDVLFVAGTPVVFPKDDLPAAYEGRMGGVLWAASVSDGKKLAEYKLDAPPTWDSLAAANGQLFLSLADGRVICMGPANP